MSRLFTEALREYSSFYSTLTSSPIIRFAMRPALQLFSKQHDYWRQTGVSSALGFRVWILRNSGANLSERCRLFHWKLAVRAVVSPLKRLQE